MRKLEIAETQAVSGGDGSVESNLGAGVAILVHGMVSDEAQVCGFLSPWGLFIGAGIHYATTH